MPDDDRTRSLLLGALDRQRRHVLQALDGLSDAQLRAAPLPSGWSLLGLVRHLTLGLERYWFHTVMAGEPLDYWPADDPAADGGRPADWRVGADASTAAVMQEYRDAIAHSDEILAGLQLDAAPRRPEEDWPAGVFADLEAVLVHVILDAATHAGHLDAARELIDGRQHLVL
ncbi:DinB family protein [Agrococcus sp. ARC_14]|uniref:DinB family protein n=1 Tax=Agrococcus sp. ARC_14 TaxID=2919927 RepID=UPI001F053A0A|nr:DinB family protein [Agrococcus sp. ARC_14]MCH1884414.1 DinB family protein [Agrococcus sp. ARC_14]